MVHLRQIQLSGFKSIRELDLELGPRNILIGANGSGKSNFVSLFRLLTEMVSKKLRLYVSRAGGADALLHFGRKATDRIRCQLHFRDSGYYFTLVPTADDGLAFASEDWYTLDGHSGELVADTPPTCPESGLRGHNSAPQPDRETYVLDQMGSWRVYHFHDTSDSARVKQTCDVHDNQFLRPDASNLAGFLYLLRVRHAGHYQNIVDAVRMVAPFFDDFDLHPSKLNENKIRLEWKELGSDAHFGPEALSDGTLRFVCQATLLLQPEPPPLIVIDEPELGLHPAAITLVSSMLRSAAAKAQVIACTQSVTLVNQFEPADVVVVDREEGQSVFRRLTEEQVKGWLDEYALGDLWEKNIIGGRP